MAKAGIATAKIGVFRPGSRISEDNPSLTLAGLQVAPNGKLRDAEGFAVAGVARKNEYVIPEWVRADPKVA